MMKRIWNVRNLKNTRGDIARLYFSFLSTVEIVSRIMYEITLS